jgi:hypothetical protein
MRRVTLVLLAVGVVLGGLAGSAFAASSVYLCVPATAGEAVTSGGSSGTCGLGTSSVALPAEKAEQEKLISILPNIKYKASGIDGKPTIQFSGVNLQLVNGSESETTLNGTGNLILGYDESPGKQTGSHDLVLGTAQSYTSYGAILGGTNNTASGADSTALGYSNTASGNDSSVVGGAGNAASGSHAAVLGGYDNTSMSSYTSITGGCSDLAGAGTLTVSSACTSSSYPHYFALADGGTGNIASGQDSTILGGKSIAENGVYGVSAGLTEAEQNKLFAIVPHLGYEEKGIDEKPTVQFSSANVQIESGEGKEEAVNGEGNLVIGNDPTVGDPKTAAQTGSNNLVLGSYNEYTGYGSIVSGYFDEALGANDVVFGQSNTASENEATVTGGVHNIAKENSSVLGGDENTASDLSTVSGGFRNEATGSTASVSGGYKNKATQTSSSVSGGEKNVAANGYDWVGGGKENTASGGWSAILGGKNNKLSTAEGEDY